MIRLILISILCLSLIGCATTSYTPRVNSELQQGKRDYEGGYYKTAMHELLPLACDGNPEAQYAVGYMYYYGYGVAQDTEVGAFWIDRSARQGYKPADAAMESIHVEKEKARSYVPRENASRDR